MLSVEKDLDDRLRAVGRFVDQLSFEDQELVHQLVSAGILKLGFWKDSNRIPHDRAWLSPWGERLVQSSKPAKQSRFTRWVFGSLLPQPARGSSVR